MHALKKRNFKQTVIRNKTFKQFPLLVPSVLNATYFVVNILFEHTSTGVLVIFLSNPCRL